MSLLKKSTPRFIFFLIIFTFIIIVSLIFFPKKNQQVERIKKGYFEEMPNKTVAELVTIISSSKARWSEMELLVDNIPKKLVVAFWKNRKGNEYKILFNYPTSDNSYVSIYEIFINDEPQGWITIGRFLDIFGLLDQGLSPKEAFSKKLKEQEKNRKDKKKEKVYEKKNLI